LAPDAWNLSGRCQATKDAQEAGDATQDAQEAGDTTQDAQDAGDATQDAQDTTAPYLRQGKVLLMCLTFYGLLDVLRHTRICAGRPYACIMVARTYY